MRVSKYSKTLTIALEPEVYNQIKEMTNSRIISMGEWFRGIVEKALTEEEVKKEDDAIPITIKNLGGIVESCGSILYIL